ncbi:MAG TPA: dienelactone hydrolase family protein, partial [Hyphomonadaceae bacterium]|nr:dienelactone hydrolase family protein [Hyphomonadaceae bacterium]
MCDDVTEAHNEALIKAGVLTRRGFTVMSAATLAACVSTPSDPKAVVERDIDITTPDGVCDAYFVAPASGRHAAIIVWPDIGGLRPAFREMGKALAQSGYAVLTVNPFYRSAKGVQYDASKETIRDAMARTGPMRTVLMAKPQNQVNDATTFVAWLDKQKEVDTGKGIGTTGYCMGGPLVMATMAAQPGRVKAGCTFHGGGLAVTTGTNEAAKAASPHLLIPKMGAKAVLCCVAQNDDMTDPAAKDVLKT